MKGYRSFSYIKIIGSQSRSQEPKVLPLTAYGHGNYFTTPHFIHTCLRCSDVFLSACRYTGSYLGVLVHPSPKMLEKQFLHCKKYAMRHTSVDALCSMTRISFWNAPILHPRLSWRSLQRRSDPLAGGEGLAASSPRTPHPLSAFQAWASAFRASPFSAL